MERLRIAVLGSGRGSNFRAILDRIASGALEVEPVVVASDVAGSGILQLAAAAGRPVYVIEEPRFRTKLSADVETRLVHRLQDARAELVVLAGYMRMIGEPMLTAFPRRIINVHPSLLPKFPGLEAWRQALEAGETVTGCTVHFVDAGMDTGEVIAQAEVPVDPGDTPHSLHAKIQEREHELLPAVVSRFALRQLP